jgi:hypothetical protein
MIGQQKRGRPALLVLHLQGSCRPLVVGGDCGSFMIPVRMGIAQVGAGKESIWVGTWVTCQCLGETHGFARPHRTC